ncbi:DUF748 domain-containing protein [Fulvivirga kasyanovii]|uniref:DUF748 domain-containing protein n=1 Tax=Fulvivirga kasyanovii TaxID=396812 RepID=A0ABW9RXE1_9BACT|nr:DUF748 domain-containing protein [Fulvivirga kasyanovii]MTI28898.1 DUF748 domain-containing protein [Fulvivirga kasyanovii]
MKRSVKILLIVLVVLIGIRIYLPFWVTDYVNKVLDDVPGYSGSIEDVDLHLYRGAYKIHKLKMVKTGEDIPVPFLDINTIDLSVQWKALFDGRLVGEVVLHEPVVNFVLAVTDTTKAEQAGGEADWTKPIKELIPLEINKFTAIDGKLTYRDYTAKPQINLSLDSLQIEARNLKNVEAENDSLPSPITATAVSIGGGRLNLNAKANLLKQIPDFDMNMDYEGVHLPALNDMTEAYAELDFERGTFNLYSEMVVADGMLTGYVKPVLTKVKVIDFSKDKKKPLQMVWEAISGVVIEIFENQPKDQFATKVPMEGDLNQVKSKIWPTIGNIFKNAFIQAFKKKTDDSISFDDLKSEEKD